MVIDMIGTVLAVDLSDDEILQESLLLHMRSAIFRMKYSTAAEKQYKQICERGEQADISCYLVDQQSV